MGFIIRSTCGCVVGDPFVAFCPITFPMAPKEEERAPRRPLPERQIAIQTAKIAGASKTIVAAVTSLSRTFDDDAQAATLGLRAAAWDGS